MPPVLLVKESLASGEQSVREANAARFKETVQREFEAFKKERLATGELECQKLITAAQSHLTQVCSQPPAQAHGSMLPSSEGVRTRRCATALTGTDRMWT